MVKLLKNGDSGPSVLLLQKALVKAGFNVGKLDGIFGDGVEAAVRAFQYSEGLTTDGKAGFHTLSALGIEDVRGFEEFEPEDVISKITPEMVSHMFPFTPKGNIVANLPYIVKSLKKFQLTDERMVLMALATIRAETESFEPVKEGISRYNTSPGGKPFDLYDNRKDLGNKGNGDGERFCGRGYIQLTGRYNYTLYGKKLGVDLVYNSNLASNREVAADILVLFLKDNETAIKNALITGDMRAARRLVNGGSHGIDRFIDAYKRGRKLLGT